MINTVTEHLQELADPAYREFSQRLIPEGKPLLGVRMGPLRTFVKQLVRDSHWSYESLGHPDTDSYHEEKLVRVLAIAYWKEIDEHTRIMLLEQVLPYLDNWAICDSLVVSLHQAKKHNSLYRDVILRQVKNVNPYAIRFSVVMLLCHYMHNPWIEENLQILGQIRHDHYYVKMAIAWAVATAFTNSFDITAQWLQSSTLDIQTAKMAAQKVRDSKRVSFQQKKIVTEIVSAMSL